jgi:hypothetical protein
LTEWQVGERRPCLRSGRQTEFRLYSVIQSLPHGPAVKLSNIKPISFPKSDAARIVTEINETREAQNDEAELVVQDIASHEAQRRTTALLKILALGEKEIAEGKVTAAADVFAELARQDGEDGA